MSKQKLEQLKEHFREEPFANLFHFSLLELKEGYARVKLEVDERYYNIFGVTHGGCIFALIDEAFELACNSHLEDAVAMSVQVNYIRPVKETSLIAEAKEVALTRKTGIYDIQVFSVRENSEETVAIARALCYRKLPKKEGE
ncbi:MAG: PaaI family thioesterase [Candidatus Atribacteria bacterium]|nr:PaaI family thioesterase [Candidatus Atribacteria bacterium]MCD6350039.1 PaaI family thioesterase [Candidatus Atribacteria bacterium]